MQIMAMLPGPMLEIRPAMPVDSTKVRRLSHTKPVPEVSRVPIALLDHD